MSSSNLVRVAFIKEATYGVTPGSGNFSTARFTSESLSASPETAESQQLRVDRMSSGQVVTGLTVGGDLNFELARDAAFDAFLESAMLNTWDVDSSVTVDLTYDATNKELTRASGNWNTTTAIGDFIILSGFTNPENNVPVAVLEFVSATVIRIGEYPGMVDETGTGTSYKRADKLTIGTTKQSFSMEKTFLDLTTKALIYKGSIANAFNLNMAYGSIATGSFSFLSNNYINADASGEFITNGRTINAAATSSSMNGSIDMPILVSSAVGDLDLLSFCVQSLEMTLNNNFTPQNCIGQIAPEDYSAGTAQITLSLSAYLADENWSVLAKKLTQEPFSLGFMIKNTDGWYGFYMPAVQASFDDPASGGQNQQISLEMQCTAKVGSSGESALNIYRS